jgi:hypothetical protein
VIVRAEAAMALATYGPVVVMIWRGVPTVARLRAGTELVRGHASARGTAVAVLSIVEQGSPLPGHVERKALASDMREVASSIVACAFVAEGAGPWARLAIDVVSAVDGFRGRTKEKLTVGAEEAAAWLVARLLESGAADAPTRDELLAAVAVIRGHPIE